MGFIELPDGRGLLYVPDQRPGARRKHPCPDCHACQLCSDHRCTVCRNRKPDSAADPEKGPQQLEAKLISSDNS
jgi:hypothetical protein